MWCTCFHLLLIACFCLLIEFVPLSKIFFKNTHFLCSCSFGKPFGIDICFVSLCWCLLCSSYSNRVSQWDPFQNIMKVLPSLSGSRCIRMERGQEGRRKWRGLHSSNPSLSTEVQLNHWITEWWRLEALLEMIWSNTTAPSRTSREDCSKDSQVLTLPKDEDTTTSLDKNDTGNWQLTN